MFWETGGESFPLHRGVSCEPDFTGSKFTAYWRAGDSAESGFRPLLVEQAGGQPHIRDTPPTICHAEVSRAAGDMEMCRETLAKYRETLAR